MGISISVVAALSVGQLSTLMLMQGQNPCQFLPLLTDSAEHDQDNSTTCSPHVSQACPCADDPVNASTDILPGHRGLVLHDYACPPTENATLSSEVPDALSSASRQV